MVYLQRTRAKSRYLFLQKVPSLIVGRVLNTPLRETIESPVLEQSTINSLQSTGNVKFYPLSSFAKKLNDLLVTMT